MQFEKAKKVQHPCQENKSKANLNLKKGSRNLQSPLLEAKGKKERKSDKMSFKGQLW